MVWYFVFTLGFAAKTVLTALTTCTCPGYTVTYECIVYGEYNTITVWKINGECSEEASLVYRDFENNSSGGLCGSGNNSTRDIILCGNGKIVCTSKNQDLETGQFLYTSQLHLNVTPNFNGSTIACARDNGTVETSMETATLLITDGTTKFLML